MMYKRIMSASLATWLLLLASCTVAIGEDVEVNNGGGTIEVTADVNGNPILAAENNSGDDLDGQFLDEDKNPIGNKISVPAGGSVTVPIPDGATYVQIGRASTPGVASGSTSEFFDFYAILPGSRSVFLPGSGVDQGEASFSQIEVHTTSGNGWQLSRDTFKVLGKPLPVVSGTAVKNHVKIIGDRSYQSGGPFSGFPVMLEIADENQITDFEVYLDGVLIANQNSPTANIQSGPWGSYATVWAWIRPSPTWLNGAAIRVGYSVPADPLPHDFTLSLGAQ